MIPGIDAKHDLERIGAKPDDEFLAIGARVRGFDGGSGWSMIIARVRIEARTDLNAAVRDATETLARASRHDSGREPDALSWIKLKAAALADLFGRCESGLALDAAAYEDAGRGGRPDRDAKSLWILRDPLADINVRGKTLQSRREKGEPAITYARLTIGESTKLIAGRVARRLADHPESPSLTPVATTSKGSFRIDPNGTSAMRKAHVATAIARLPQCREVATAAALVGSEVVTLFERAVPHLEIAKTIEEATG